MWKHGALHPQKPWRLIRDGEVGVYILVLFFIWYTGGSCLVSATPTPTLFLMCCALTPFPPLCECLPHLAYYARLCCDFVLVYMSVVQKNKKQTFAFVNMYAMFGRGEILIVFLPVDLFSVCIWLSFSFLCMPVFFFLRQKKKKRRKKAWLFTIVFCKNKTNKKTKNKKGGFFCCSYIFRFVVKHWVHTLMGWDAPLQQMLISWTSWLFSLVVLLYENHTDKTNT